MTMDATQKLRDLALSESGFVFDPCSGSTFTVNRTGLAIIQMIKQGRGRDEIVAHLEQAFLINGQDLHRDLDEFLHLLRSNALLPQGFTL
jgi:PqqD family protein of HPr-rel-A system